MGRLGHLLGALARDPVNDSTTDRIVEIVEGVTAMQHRMVQSEAAVERVRSATLATFDDPLASPASTATGSASAPSTGRPPRPQRGGDVMELDEAVAIVRDALHGTTERNTVTDVRPALAPPSRRPRPRTRSWTRTGPNPAHATAPTATNRAGTNPGNADQARPEMSPRRPRPSPADEPIPHVANTRDRFDEC
jgi:hypothetical protein